MAHAVKTGSTHVETSHSPLMSTPPPTRTEADVAAAGRDPVFAPMVLCPLHNLGNTCYFNSGLQIMCNCPSLLYTMRDSAFTHENPSIAHKASVLGCTGGPPSHALFCSFADLLSRMQYEQLGDAGSIRPSAQLEALARVNPMFEGRSQQDCSEFFNTVLATVEDEGRLSIQLDQLLESFANAAEQDKKAAAQAIPAKPTSDDKTENCFTPLEGCSDRSLSDLRIGAGSAHNLAVLKLMHDVNEANEALERRAAARKKEAYKNSFQPPRLFFNSVSDAFKGYTLSTIQCHGCHSTSRVVEAFTSLMLDLPTGEQRAAFASRHPDIRRLGPDGRPLTQKKKPSTLVWWNPLTYFTTLFRKLSDLCAWRSVRYPLTLQECLDIHFEPATLSGSNRYRCDACGQSCEATKQETLLDLPEYLVLQMKRFKAGACFNSKKTDPVIFPISWSPLTPEEANGTKRRAVPEVLDLYRYVDPTIAPFVKPLPPALSTALGRPRHQGEGEPRPNPNPVQPFTPATNAPDECTSLSPAGTPAGAQPTDRVSTEAPASLTATYTLEGVVVHHGSFGGGHYTVYVRKLDRGRETWVYLSDDAVETVQLEEVADAEEYMLLYRKQSPVTPAPADLELRYLARFYLRKGVADTTATSAATVFVSRMWLHRMALMTDPGPVVNGLCYCTAEERTRVTSQHRLFPQGSTKVPQSVPHVHGPPVEWYYVPIAEADFNKFHAVYGGDAAVTATTVQAVKRDQDRFVALVDKRSGKKA